MNLRSVGLQLIFGSIAVIIGILFGFGGIIKYLFVGTAAIFVSVLLFLLISPLLKNRLLHNPDIPNQSCMFVQVGTGRSVAIDFGGNFAYQIDDNMTGPVPSSGLLGLWMMYKWYIWLTTRYHVYVPFFTEPKVYELTHRYKQTGVDNKLVYKTVGENDSGYRSNHVRTAPFTWLFRFPGIKIQKIPFTVKGSVQMLIARDKVKDALYLTESWNILLDQALNSAIRAVISEQVTVDMVWGSVSEILWTESPVPAIMNQLVATLIFNSIKEYRFDDSAPGTFSGKKLADLGIVIFKVDITDFEDELSEPERVKMRASTFGREAGRARHLSDQGVAKGQAALLDLLEKNPTLAVEILKNRSLVDAIAGGGSIETLIASYIQKIRS